MRSISILVVLFMLSGVSRAQSTHPQSRYDPHVLFAPGKEPLPVNGSRTAHGEPGPDYWQNRADYRIRSTLDTVRRRISATLDLTYHNRSPHMLRYLWFQLDQQLFSRQSRGQLRMPGNGRSRYGDAAASWDGGFQITSVEQLGAAGARGDTLSTLAFDIQDTRMQVMPAQPLRAMKDSVRIRIVYSYLIPEYGADRFGISQSKYGSVFCIAQWYPRICVFDDVRGWNTDPYLGAGEFYLEYGDFDVEITAPASMVVTAGAELLNPREVLSVEQQSRWDRAARSEQTVFIRKEEDWVKAAPAERGKTKSWRYRLRNARDFAWAASAAFVWDAAQIRLPSGRTALAMSCYPVESQGRTAWGRSTEYVKASVEQYSRRWFEYPYPVAVNVASNVGGMEYPGIVFCSSGATGEGLFGVTDHEFGHTWFPMIVGSQERRYGWMDEGFNTFINSLADDDFNQGEYRSPEANGEELAYAVFSPYAEGIYHTPDALREENIGLSLYYKPAVALKLLRSEVLGPARFDQAFRYYIRTWAYKHPTPWDFFRLMNNVSGEDLTWFWNSWFLENRVLDQSVDTVEYDPSRSFSLVTISNLRDMAMPVKIRYTTQSGRAGNLSFPVEIWNNRQVFTFRVPEPEPLKEVLINPDKVLPETDFTNNAWIRR